MSAETCCQSGRFTSVLWSSTDINRQLAVQAFARSVWGQDIIRGKIIDSIMTWVTEERVSSK